jgi:hypothetical protein
MANVLTDQQRAKFSEDASETGVRSSAEIAGQSCRPFFLDPALQDIEYDPSPSAIPPGAREPAIDAVWTLVTGTDWRIEPVRSIGESREPAYGDLVAHMFEERARTVVQRIRANLECDAKEASVYGRIGPDPRSIEICVRLVNRIAPHIVFAPKVKCGVFTEEDGVVALVLQSLETDRRLTCRFAADGSAREYRVDERGVATERELPVDDERTPRELTEWVKTRA